MKYPEKTQQVMCYDNDGKVRHLVEVNPNNVCTTGQPNMTVRDTKLELYNEVKAFPMSIKSEAILAEYKVEIDKEILELEENKILNKT